MLKRFLNVVSFTALCTTVAVSNQRAQEFVVPLNFRLAFFDVHVESRYLPRRLLQEPRDWLGSPEVAQIASALSNDSETREVLAFVTKKSQQYYRELGLTRWFIRRHLYRKYCNLALAALAAVDPQLKDFAAELCGKSALG